MKYAQHRRRSKPETSGTPTPGERRLAVVGRVMFGVLAVFMLAMVAQDLFYGTTRAARSPIHITRISQPLYYWMNVVAELTASGLMGYFAIRGNLRKSPIDEV